MLSCRQQASRCSSEHGGLKREGEAEGSMSRGPKPPGRAWRFYLQNTHLKIKLLIT